jgi:uncharacterized protein
VKIKIDALKDKAVELADEEAVAGYPTLMALEEAGECSFLAPLRIRLTVAREYDHIRVEGQVATTLGLSCARCLVEYRAEIASPFTIFFMKSTGTVQDEEVELAEQDLISATYEGDVIDFSEEIAAQIITAIPFKPLCSEECRGLCPSCGTDLNTAPCACGQDEVNIKMSALKNFKAAK